MTADSVRPLVVRPRGVAARHLTRAALGFGAVTAGLVGAVGASWATLQYQAKEATDAIEDAARRAALDAGMLAEDIEFRWQDLPPRADGVYLPGALTPAADEPAALRTLTMMGDSTSVGYGCVAARQLPGVLLARSAADALHLAVRLTTRGVVGSTSADLPAQLDSVLADRPDTVAIMVGANDVRDRVPPTKAARELGEVVRGLRERDIAVVVGTCPDLGVITPMHAPLRQFAGVWSRRLARAQERTVAAADGISVALDRLVSPDFYGRPDLFYADGFHPSALGYAKATAALAPAVIEALA